ncbi:hypothetical protein ACN9M0_36650 [Streptomyces sp. R-07]|uniref:hypothetical protein n=1 Tax=Streptomyces sp. R-07 TaxID=3404052 RepID=UPI003CF9DB09
MTARCRQVLLSLGRCGRPIRSARPPPVRRERAVLPAHFRMEWNAAKASRPGPTPPAQQLTLTWERSTWRPGGSSSARPREQDAPALKLRALAHLAWASAAHREVTYRDVGWLSLPT